MAQFEHFDGSMPSWLTAISQNSGSVAITDSYAEIQRPGASDVAYLYDNRQIDINTAGVYHVCVSDVSSSFRAVLSSWSTSDPTTPISFVDFTPFDIRIEIALSSGSYNLDMGYMDGSGNYQVWNPSTNAFSTTRVALADKRVGQDNFAEFAVEFDGAGNFRFVAFTIKATSYTNNQGRKTAQLSDWVAFSSTQNGGSSSYWIFNNPFNDTLGGDVVRVEWIDIGAGPVRAGYSNGKSSIGGQYQIFSYRHYDNDRAYPVSRAVSALPVASPTAWDDNFVKDPVVVEYPAGTFNMFYTGGDPFQVGLATSSDKFGLYTRDPGNPIISRVAGTDRDLVFFPYPVIDPDDPDPSKLVKVIVAGFSSLDSKWRLYLYTAAAVAGPYTFQGQVTAVGGGGEWDESGVNDSILFWHAGQWEHWYGGQTGGTGWFTGRQYGTDLLSLTKDPANPIASPLSVRMNVSSLTGRTLTVADTTGMLRDMLLMITEDNVADNWVATRIRKVVNGTTVELYHELAGITSGGRLAQFDSLDSWYPRHLENDGGTWKYFAFTGGGFNDTGTRTAFNESSVLLERPGAPGSGGTFVVNALKSPTITHDLFFQDVSCENYTLTTQQISRASLAPNLRSFAYVPLKITKNYIGPAS